MSHAETVYLVRHAKAGERRLWTEADIERPLSKRGWRQSEAIAKRLAKKGALKFTRQGRGYLYEPVITEKDCQGAESKSFLQRVFGGSVAPLLSHMVEEEQLSSKEMSELRKLLRERKSK